MRIKMYLGLCAFLFICSCSEQKEMTEEDIYNFDNYYVYHAPNVRIIDSLIDEHPTSDYPHGLKIMYIAQYINPDSAINFGNNRSKSVVYGTFIATGYALAITQIQKQWESSKESIERDLIRSYNEDKKKLNIWNRILIGNELVRLDSLSHAFKYYQEALDINPDNAYIKELIVKLSLKRNDTSEAKYYLDLIPKDYKPERIKKYREKLLKLCNQKN